MTDTSKPFENLAPPIEKPIEAPKESGNTDNNSVPANTPLVATSAVEASTPTIVPEVAKPAVQPVVAPVPTPTPVAPQTPSPASQTEPEEVQKPDELQMLKSRATLMGISYSNNIGIEALRAKIDEKLNPKKDMVTSTDVGDQEGLANTTKSNKIDKGDRPLTLRERLFKDNMKLIRVRITNLDPKKKDLPGEIITVANRYIGTVKKFVPYGEVTDGGYHIPYVIFKMLKKRKFLNIRSRKGANGQDITETNYVNEFAIEELPMLTQAELTRLAQAQIAAGSVAPLN